MHQDYQKNFYELIYHKNAKFFLKKFIEGSGTTVFMSVINMPEKEAHKEAKKLGKAVERYTKALYQMDVRAKRYGQSFNRYINQPQVIAGAMNYILNTLYSLYPQYYLQLFTAIASNIFQGRIHTDPKLPTVNPVHSQPVVEMQTITVESLMIPEAEVLRIPATSRVKEFYSYLLKYGYHGYPVVNTNGKVVGLISYWRIKKMSSNDEDYIKSFMYRIKDNDPVKVAKHLSVEMAYKTMLSSKLGRLLVYDKWKFVGLLAKSAVLRSLKFRDEVL